MKLLAKRKIQALHLAIAGAVLTSFGVSFDD